MTLNEKGMAQDYSAVERLQSEDARALKGFWEVRYLEPRAMALERDGAAPRMIQPALNFRYQKIINRLRSGVIENLSGRSKGSQQSMGPSAG